MVSLKTGCLILAVLVSVSCINSGDKEKELDIGLPTKICFVTPL